MAKFLVVHTYKREKHFYVEANSVSEAADVANNTASFEVTEGEEEFVSEEVYPTDKDN